MEGVGGVAHAVAGTQQPWKLPAHHAEVENSQVFGGDDPQGVY